MGSAYTLRRLGGRHPLWGIGVVSRIVLTRMPALAIALIADSRPPPGPLTLTSHCCIPASCAFFAASNAACWAAKGVPFREPRKPLEPEDDCAIKLPSRSVMEIIVLLNDAATCTIPIGMFFLSFLRKTFFFPPVLPPAAFAIYVRPSTIGDRPWSPVLGLSSDSYFFPGAFFLATVCRRGPLRVRAFVCVR